MPAPNPIIKGLTSIVWGTNNQVSLPAGAVVESLAVTPKNAKPVADIEDGNGASITEVLLVDGFDATVMCLYDLAKAWPVEGSNVNVVIPSNAGNMLGVGQSGSVLTYTCLVCSLAPDTKRKKEAGIKMEVTFRPNVAV